MKCLTSAKASTTIYRDHLPLLGKHYHHTLLEKKSLQNLNHHNRLQYEQLEIGDSVSY